MVLIQTLTVDAINTALIALQRGQSIIIGGDKGQTVNNINVTNKTEGADYFEKIKELTSQIETLKETDTALKAEDVRINDRLNALTQLGISDFTFDDSTRELSIELTDGNVYTTIIRPVPFILSLSGNTLILENEYQREEVELPFILSSEKGAANGVATLDATGRVPYSQLSESAMEFKGEWNADTNTPHLEDGTGTNGDFYICSQGGTVNFGTSQSPRNITFYVNDRVIYQGDVGQWKRLPASEVRTVNGQSGDVVLNGTNVNYSNANNSPTLKDKIDTVEGYAKTQSDWSQSDNTKIDYIKNKPNLAAVATSGSYNDLSNKPTIPAAQIQSDWTQTNSSSKDFIKNKIPIWITSGSADDNMSPIDSVTDGNMRPVTSNAVFDNKYKYIYTKILSTAGWYKIATLGGRAYGATISIDLFTAYQYQRNCSHNIQVNYGWVSSSVKDFAKDADAVFDKIRICFNSNNTDPMAIYVHYKPTQGNPCYINIRAGTTVLIPVNFETDSLTWGTTQEFNLGTEGLYQNGQRVTVTPNVYFTELDRNSESDRITAMGVLTVNRENSGIGTIRYANGFYYYYSWNNTTVSEQTIIETNPYTGTINIFKKDGNNTISRVRTI